MQKIALDYLGIFKRYMFREEKVLEILCATQHIYIIMYNNLLCFCLCLFCAILYLLSTVYYYYY